MDMCRGNRVTERQQVYTSFNDQCVIASHLGGGEEGGEGGA
jgi:hypothetical protein